MAANRSLADSEQQQSKWFKGGKGKGNDDESSDGVASILAAINAQSTQMNTRFNTLETNLTNQVSALDKKTTERFDVVQSQADNTAKLLKDTISDLEKTKKEFTEFKEGKSNNVYSVSGGSGSVSRDDFVPISKRKVVFVGGWPEGGERADIEATLKDLTKECKDSVAEVWATKRVGGSGKIKFLTNDDMWAFLKAHKGVRFNYNGKPLFHSIDKTSSELDLSGKVAKAVRAIKEHLVSNGVKMEDTKQWIEADYNIGRVYVRSVLRGPLKLVFDKPCGEKLFVVMEEGELPYNSAPKDHIEDINADYKQ